LLKLKKKFKKKFNKLKKLIFLDFNFSKKMEKIQNFPLLQLARAREEIAILVERDGHHPIGRVECFFHTWINLN